ncbi:hypothetical protein HOF51_02030 [bacterium]|nr:hypothetical protein [bacterium]
MQQSSNPKNNLRLNTKVTIYVDAKSTTSKNSSKVFKPEQPQDLRRQVLTINAPVEKTYWEIQQEKHNILLKKHGQSPIKKEFKQKDEIRLSWSEMKIKLAQLAKMRKKSKKRQLQRKHQQKEKQLKLMLENRNLKVSQIEQHRTATLKLINSYQ